MSEKEIIQLTAKLISINTYLADNKKEILDFILKILKPQNYKIIENNGCYSLLISNKNSFKPQIILNAHLDVVNGIDTNFKPMLKNDRIYGRGALDMKGAAAVMVLLFKNIAKKLRYEICLQLVTDEETGGRNGTNYQVNKFNLKPQFVIIGEPTNLKIVNQSKGVIKLRIKTTGKSAHCAFPWKGDNAIMSMIKLINKLDIFNDVKGKWQTTYSISNIYTSNKEFNVIPEDCEIEVDIRYIPKEDPELIIKRISDVLPECAKITLAKITPYHYTQITNQYVKLLASMVTDNTCNFSKIEFSTDAKFYTQKKVPTIVFGPSGKGLHAIDEYVDIRSLNKYYEILFNFLYSIK